MDTVIGPEERERLVEIVSVVLDIDPALVSDALSPEQLEQWDSLNHVNICMAVAQEFNVEFTTEEIGAIRSVGDVVRLLSAKGVG